MKIIYKAFDGKEFEDEQECLNYEKKQSVSSWGHKVVAFNRYRERIDPCEFEKTYYIGIANENIYAEYAAMSEDAGVEPPEGPGEWYFKDGDGWYLFSDCMEELKEQMRELEDMRDQMRGE